MPNPLDPLGLFDAAERDARRISSAVQVGIPATPRWALEEKAAERRRYEAMWRERPIIRGLEQALSTNIEDERKAQVDYHNQAQLASRASVQEFTPAEAVQALRHVATELEAIAAEQRSHELRFMRLLDRLHQAGG